MKSTGILKLATNITMSVVGFILASFFTNRTIVVAEPLNSDLADEIRKSILEHQFTRVCVQSNA